MLQQIPLFNMFGLRDSGAVKVGRHLTFNSRAETGTKAENDGAAAGAEEEGQAGARGDIWSFCCHPPPPPDTGSGSAGHCRQDTRCTHYITRSGYVGMCA